MKTKSIIQNRKGKVNFNKSITTGVILVISIVVLLTIWSELMPEAQVAGDSMNDSNRCNTAGCFYNGSITDVTSASSPCRSNASVDPAVKADGTGGDNSTSCTADFTTIPLSSLFGGKGIIILMLMVLALVTGLRIVLRMDKK